MFGTPSDEYELVPIASAGLPPWFEQDHNAWPWSGARRGAERLPDGRAVRRSGSRRFRAWWSAKRELIPRMILRVVFIGRVLTALRRSRANAIGTGLCDRYGRTEGGERTATARVGTVMGGGYTARCRRSGASPRATWVAAVEVCEIAGPRPKRSFGVQVKRRDMGGRDLPKAVMPRRERGGVVGFSNGSGSCLVGEGRGGAALAAGVRPTGLVAGEGSEGGRCGRVSGGGACRVVGCCLLSTVVARTNWQPRPGSWLASWVPRAPTDLRACCRAPPSLGRQHLPEAGQGVG
jgi:hypothetical protein